MLDLWNVFCVNDSRCNNPTCFIVQVNFSNFTNNTDFIPVHGCARVIIKRMAIFLYLLIVFVAVDLPIRLDFTETQPTANRAHIEGFAILLDLFGIMAFTNIDCVQDFHAFTSLQREIG